MARVALEQAYPDIAFRPQSRNWWARLTGAAPECVHLETDHAWMATLVPDTLYVRGKPALRRAPARPEVSLCRECLLAVLRLELAGYRGRIVAFEPNAEAFTQYFFISTADFDAAGLQPALTSAIEQRLAAMKGLCQASGECARRATWLWLAREDVTSLDEADQVGTTRGRLLCAAHGAATLCRSFEAMPEANLFYMNVPYGEAGAYVWI